MTASAPKRWCCSGKRAGADRVESLPVDFREVIVLRELEGLSYKNIAAVVGVPVATVMSRLSGRLVGRS